MIQKEVKFLDKIRKMYFLKKIGKNVKVLAYWPALGDENLEFEDMRSVEILAIYENWETNIKGFAVFTAMTEKSNPDFKFDEMQFKKSYQTLGNFINW